MKMWKIYCFRADKKCRSDSWKSQFSNTSFSPFFIKIKFYHNFNIIPLQGPRSRNTIRASSKFKLSRTGPYVFHITNVQLYKIIPQHVSTYQALHFCVRDVPGASRSELDADCWVSWALYTRHTFAFVGDPSARAQAAVPPHSLLYVCSTKSSTIVVPSTNHRSPWNTRPTVTIPQFDFVFFFFIPTNTPTNMCAQVFAHTVLINGLRINFHQYFADDWKNWDGFWAKNSKV